MLAEKLGDSFYDHKIRIYATDVDGKEIIKARMGTYHMDRLKNIGKEDLNKYFVPENSGYLIRTDIRQRIIFNRQNLTVDAPFSNIDLVVYRYALIYYDLEQQNRIMNKLNHALRALNDELASTRDELGARIERFTSKEKLNKMILQNINQGLIELDEEHTVKLWNPAVEKIWGLKESDALGKGIFSLNLGIKSKVLKQRIEEAKERKTIHREEKLEYISPSGGKRLIELTVIPLIDTEGKPGGAILLV